MADQVILLDLDDTLYPYAPCNRIGLQAAHAQLQKICPDLDLTHFTQLHDEVRSHWAQRLSGTAASHNRILFFKRIIECCVEKGDLPTLDAAHALGLDRAYWSAFHGAIQGHPEMMDVLTSLNGSARLGLVTNQVAEAQLGKLRALEITHYFDAIVTSEEAGAEKPDPRIYLEALDRLGGEAEHAWMIGDSAADMAGASQCGIRTIQTIEYNQPSVPIKADYTIERLPDVLDILRR